MTTTWNTTCPICAATIADEMPPLELSIHGEKAWIRVCGAACAKTLSQSPLRYVSAAGARDREPRYQSMSANSHARRLASR
jgi:hypothetical protein